MYGLIARLAIGALAALGAISVIKKAIEVADEPKTDVHGRIIEVSNGKLAFCYPDKKFQSIKLPGESVLEFKPQFVSFISMEGKLPCYLAEEVFFDLFMKFGIKVDPPDTLSVVRQLREIGGRKELVDHCLRLFDNECDTGENISYAQAIERWVYVYKVLSEGFSRAEIRQMVACFQEGRDRW